jgi:hypothetical protein|tara:strand:- start:2851 stop:3243 length:393 start_codon:yes stop_codon:yes gene_type:complete
MTNFKINSQKDSSTNETTEVFTFWGKHDFEDIKGFPMLNLNKKENAFDMIDAYAVKITRGSKSSYYVRRGKHGRLYNPIGMYSEGNANKKLRQGQFEWNLKPTSQKIFDYYTNFLKTKNTAWLNNAEREI